MCRGFVPLRLDEDLTSSGCGKQRDGQIRHPSCRTSALRHSSHCLPGDMRKSTDPKRTLPLSYGPTELVYLGYGPVKRWWDPDQPGFFLRKASCTYYSWSQISHVPERRMPLKPSPQGFILDRTLQGELLIYRYGDTSSA